MPEYTEYTPTIEEVRDNYMSGVAWVAEGFDRGVGFDRMIARVKAEAGAAALEAFADSKWGQRLRGRLIVDAELSIRERAAALRSALEGEHTERTITHQWGCDVDRFEQYGQPRDPHCTCGADKDTQAASDERRDNRSDEQRPGLTDRAALEGEPTEPKLDPEPWVSVTGVRHDGRLGTRYSSSVNPRPGFDQNLAHYPGGTR